MTNTKTVDFNKAAEIITRHFRENGYPQIKVRAEDIHGQSFVEEWGYIAPLDPFNNFGTQLFQSSSEDRSLFEGTYSHYKNPVIAKEILSSRCFHASHLSALSANDDAELVHFMRQMGHDLALGNQPPSKIIEHYPKGVLAIDQIKDDVYVLCLTQDISNEFFWNEYADNHRGVRFRLRYRPTGLNSPDDHNLFPLYSFRKVIYDNDTNDKFSFFVRMNEELLTEVGHELMVSPVNLLAAFYKQRRFHVEDETRLCFDLAYLRARYSYPEHISVNLDRGRKYIRIPIKDNRPMPWNSLPFELELIEVVCGREMREDSQDYIDIKRIMDRMYPDIPLTKEV